MASDDRLTVTITGDASGLNTALERLQAEVRQTMSGVQTSLEQGTRATQQFSERTIRHLASIERSFDGLRSTITGIQHLLATLTLGAGLGVMAQQAIETASSFEQLDTMLKFVTKSMEDFAQAKQFIL